MKSIIFFFSLFYLSFSFVVMGESLDSISYYQDNEHFLIKRTVLKKDYTTYEIDSGKILVQSYRNIVFKENLSKLPEEFWHKNNYILNLIIENNHEVSITDYFFLTGIFLGKQQSFIFDKNKNYFNVENKIKPNILAFCLVVVYLASIVFIFFKNYFLSKFAIFFFFVSFVVYISLNITLLQDNFYIWFNLPNIVLFVVMFYILHVKRNSEKIKINQIG
ncbi:MAG: hypothetical protein WC011_04340 [Candidatus Paceibacterota bacterium]